METPCPYNNWVITARKLCADPDRYHCLIDEFSRRGWICTDPIWVEAGKKVKKTKDRHCVEILTIIWRFKKVNTLNINDDLATKQSTNKFEQTFMFVEIHVSTSLRLITHHTNFRQMSGLQHCCESAELRTMCWRQLSNFPLSVIFVSLV